MEHSPKTELRIITTMICLAFLGLSFMSFSLDHIIEGFVFLTIIVIAIAVTEGAIRLS